MQTITQPQNEKDIAAVRKIWREVFGGKDEEEAFFHHYFDLLRCVTVSSNGVYVSSGHLLPSGDFVCAEFSFPIAMIYAVATLPQYRSLGYGATVVRKLILSAQTNYGAAAILTPTEDSLFGYYASRTDLCDFFYIKETVLKKPSKKCGYSLPALITPQEYCLLRSELLRGIPHVKTDLHALTYQEMLCKIYGGGLYVIDTPEGFCCAAIEYLNYNTVCIKELLTPSKMPLRDAASSVIEAFPAERHIARTPAKRSDTGSEVRRFAMLASCSKLKDAINTSAYLPWLGIAFD